MTPRWLALAAGGTGGHMFPAQALAQEMRRRGWSILLLTDARGMRFTEQFPADEIITLAAANPNVRGPAAKVAMARAMLGGVRTARRALTAHRPLMTVGFGGYPSAPGLFASWSKGLPYAVHEQNAVLGRVNRQAAPRAGFVAHGFERLDRLPICKGDVLQTGNPVRDAVADVMSTPYQVPDENRSIRLLIFGGSQGAALFGRVFAPALAGLPEDLRSRLEVVHQAADDMAESVTATYNRAGIKAEVAPFFVDLPRKIADAHFVVARSGASSVTELSVIGRPALFVPLGIAMDDHQRANAEVLVRAGAADLLLEQDATPEAALALLLPRLRDREGLAAAAKAAKGRVPSDASDRLGDLIENFLEASL
ncbi:MAG: UDP-N-acetylglucosamine--N-acetylmuramyl-(pentapeptide) pyrophosphoryl-undecaprenol N-acetylglucosamine transferase [Pseudomonadota bacterium]